MRYRLAQAVAVQASGQGAFLVGERPLRAVRLNAPLRRLVERCRGPGTVPATPAEGRALEALARRGYLERDRVPILPEEALPSVSVVIPVKDRAGELERCLRSLVRLDYPRDRLEVVVVDDGSRDDSREVARRLGARVAGSGGCGVGPASARNRGAGAARGEILAFIDSDCTASPGWLRELVGAFEDPDIAAVGGRVEGMHVATRLDRYEAAMSSLSLGRRERAAQEGDDTFYLPSCNLLVRRSAFLAVGGFREGMQVGEDVDLTWRLRDRGGKILYTPRGWVWHEHRNEWVAFLKRRFEYGTSEAQLQVRHPHRRKKIALPPALTAAALLLALGVLGGAGVLLAAGAAIAAADALWVHSRLARRGVALTRRRVAWARVRALGSLAYYVGGHVLRYYAVPAVALAVAWPGFGVLLAGLVGWVGLVEYAVRRPSLPVAAFFLFYLLEQLAYGAGAFWGCVRQGSFSSYRPLVYRRMEMTFG
ncbi:MAG: mycofactocin biosynthesis glycosyltransferase MftF [Deferrisomatales bacterium]